MLIFSDPLIANRWQLSNSSSFDGGRSSRIISTNRGDYLVDYMQDLRKHRPDFLVSAAVSVGAVLFGFDTGVAGVAGGVVALGSFRAEFGLASSRSGSASASSNVVALLNLGAFLGALAPPLAGRFVGPPALLACAGFFFLLGSVVQMAASGPGLGMIYGGRVVAGLGVGLISNVAPVFAAECSPKHLRGMMVSPSPPVSSG